MQNLAASFANMEAGGNDPNKEDQPWYVKYGIKGLGTVAGGLAMLLGVTNAIFSLLSPTCIIFSIWQVLVGFVVLAIESPCCFFFMDHLQVITNKIQSFPLYVKAAIYVAAPLPSLIFCLGVSTFLGSGLIMVTGAVYGFLALGKKASREEMARNAQSMSGPQARSSSVSTNDKATLVENLRDPKPNTPPSFDNPYQNSPPPSYSDSTTSAGRVGWDTSYTTATLQTPTYNQSGTVASGTVNPVSSAPYNPFQ